MRAVSCCYPSRLESSASTHAARALGSLRSLLGRAQHSRCRLAALRLFRSCRSARSARVRRAALRLPSEMCACGALHSRCAPARAVKWPLVPLVAALRRSLAGPFDSAKMAGGASLGSACLRARGHGAARPPIASGAVRAGCAPPISAAPSGLARRVGSRPRGPLWAQPPRWGQASKGSAVTASPPFAGLNPYVSAAQKGGVVPPLRVGFLLEFREPKPAWRFPPRYRRRCSGRVVSHEVYAASVCLAQENSCWSFGQCSAAHASGQGPRWAGRGVQPLRAAVPS